MKFGIEIVPMLSGTFDLVMHAATMNMDNSVAIVSATKEELVELRSVLDRVLAGPTKFEVEFE